MNKPIIYILVILILAIGAYIWFAQDGDLNFKPNPTETLMASPSVTATPQGSIQVTSPAANETVGSPITVTGRARVFEQTFSYKLIDQSNNKLLVEGAAMSTGQELSEFNPFSFKIVVPTGTSGQLLLELIDYSAKDGSVSYKVSIPLKLASTETMKVKAYFSKGNPTDCKIVQPVERAVVKTQEVAYVALTELLKGPTSQEKTAGYLTSIPEGTLPMNMRINSLRISNGVAHADFSGDLEAGVGGSCRVTAIRSQIENTLKQFPTVKSVVISINGRTEDILQP